MNGIMKNIVSILVVCVILAASVAAKFPPGQTYSVVFSDVSYVSSGFGWTLCRFAATQTGTPSGRTPASGTFDWVPVQGPAFIQNGVTATLTASDSSATITSLGGTTSITVVATD